MTVATLSDPAAVTRPDHYAPGEMLPADVQRTPTEQARYLHLLMQEWVAGDLTRLGQLAVLTLIGDGWSTRDIGRVLGVTQAAIVKRAERGRAGIRSLFPDPAALRGEDPHAGQD